MLHPYFKYIAMIETFLVLQTVSYFSEEKMDTKLSDAFSAFQRKNAICRGEADESENTVNEVTFRYIGNTIDSWEALLPFAFAPDLFCIQRNVI
jgi:hypothetical protein